jgi:hypothetical protein
MAVESEGMGSATLIRNEETRALFPPFEDITR